MINIGYNHKLILWRLSSQPTGVYVVKAGFNSRSTFKSLVRAGLITIEERGNGSEYAYLTEAGKAWVQVNPDRAIK